MQSTSLTCGFVREFPDRSLINSLCFVCQEKNIEMAPGCSAAVQKPRWAQVGRHRGCARARVCVCVRERERERERESKR